MDSEAFYQPGPHYLWALTVTVTCDQPKFSLIGIPNNKYAAAYGLNNQFVQIRDPKEYWLCQIAKTKKHRQRIMLASAFKVK